MPKYRDIPMGQRIDMIGALLAKGIYLYIQKQKELEKASKTCDNSTGSENSDESGASLGEGKPKNELY
jgi:hypothetical protein